MLFSAPIEPRCIFVIGLNAVVQDGGNLILMNETGQNRGISMKRTIICALVFIWIICMLSGCVLCEAEKQPAYRITSNSTAPVKVQPTCLQANSGIPVESVVTFGSYEQDNNWANGAEPIEWIVLNSDDSKALLISKHCLDAQVYHTEWELTTWENCYLRAWLNRDFYYTAFNSSEQKAICTTKVSAEKNLYNKINPGQDTQDKVFLLSQSEAKTYFSSDYARKAQCTEYTKSRWTYSGDYAVNNWWLRSPEDYPSDVFVYGVCDDGSIGMFESGTTTVAVRPVIWVDLTKIS